MFLARVEFTVNDLEQESVYIHDSGFNAVGYQGRGGWKYSR